MAIIHRMGVPCSSLRRHWVHASVEHKLVAALLLSVLGWSVTWAQALSLISVVPTWFAIGLFYGGLGLIPFCKSPSTDRAAVKHRDARADQECAVHLSSRGQIQ